MILRTNIAVIIAITLLSEAAQTSELERKQLLDDCKHEAVAVGLTGTDIDDYVIECVEDFEETEITNTQLSPEK